MKNKFIKAFTLIRKSCVREQGFTLIELLVVISIIGILIGLSIFGLEGARRSSRDAKRKADLELVRSGLEIYRSDCGAYPSSLTFGGTLVGTGSTTSCSSSINYINNIPLDPLNPTDTYYYVSPTNTIYYLCAYLEQTPNPTPDPSGDIANCTGNCGVGSCNYVVKNP